MRTLIALKSSSTLPRSLSSRSATRLAGISPVAAGVTAKRFANIRSDFLAAIKASGLVPITRSAKKPLSSAWGELSERLSGRRAHLGLSRLAWYATSKAIEPANINDEVIAEFITSVREGSLHRKPNALHRQVTLIWNEAARDPRLGLRAVTVPSFRGPPKRIDWSLLRASFRQDIDDYLSWCGGSDPFAADARSRALAPRTLRLCRDQVHAAASALVGSGVNRRAFDRLPIWSRPITSRPFCDDGLKTKTTKKTPSSSSPRQSTRSRGARMGQD